MRLFPGDINVSHRHTFLTKKTTMVTMCFLLLASSQIFLLIASYYLFCSLIFRKQWFSARVRAEAGDTSLVTFYPFRTAHFCLTWPLCLCNLIPQTLIFSITTLMLSLMLLTPGVPTARKWQVLLMACVASESSVSSTIVLSVMATVSITWPENGGWGEALP